MLSVLRGSGGACVNDACSACVDRWVCARVVCTCHATKMRVCEGALAAVQVVCVRCASSSSQQPRASVARKAGVGRGVHRRRPVTVRPEVGVEGLEAS